MGFDKAFALTVNSEGGFGNDSRDKGNWTSGIVNVGVLKGTKYGISAAAYPNLDIRNLTLEQAKAIYLTDYWQAAGCDKLPEVVRFDHFDMAVNSGVFNAKKILQRAVGVEDDGIVGPKTLAAIAAIAPEKLDKNYSAQRLLFICNLSTWPLYGKGIVRRVANNLLKD